MALGLGVLDVAQEVAVLIWRQGVECIFSFASDLSSFSPGDDVDGYFAVEKTTGFSQPGNGSGAFSTISNGLARRDGLSFVHVGSQQPSCLSRDHSFGPAGCSLAVA